MKRILLALMVLNSIAVAAQDAVLLRVNYQPGDMYTLNVNTDADMGMSGFMNTNMTLAMKVTAVEDGLFKTESQLSSIRMNVEQGGMDMSYDSNMKAEELDEIGQMMKSQFDPMLNATIYNTIDPFGASVETRVEPAIDGMEQLTQTSGAIKYPLEKVSVGSTWAAEQERDGMTMNINYTVRSISGDTIILDISGDITGTGSGTMKGFTSIDLNSGVQTNSEIAITITTQDVLVNTTVKSTITKV